LSELVSEARVRLEELEEIVSAISGGRVDAVVVDQGGQPEVWTLEATDRLHLKMCQQAANVGTWLWEASTNELACSETLLQILGLPDGAQPDVDQITGLIPADERDAVTKSVRTALKRSSDYYHEWRIVRPDGSPRWLAVSGRMIASASTGMERLVGIALDITERRQVEEDLKLADRRKDEFLAMLAHELRNPLAAISNAVRLSRRSDLGEKDQAWVQDMLDRQTDQLVRLVDDLLDVARIARGRIELARDTVPLAEVVNRAVESVRLQIDRAHHRLQVQFGDAPLWVEGDRTRLEQIFVNLLGNAAKYTPEGGQIWLRLASDGDNAVITVCDSGIGISREMLPRVFDMFAQAEQGLARSQGGLGIGLTLVRRLVELHGGAITAESSGAGQGSTFTIRLPLATPPELTSAGRAPAAADKVAADPPPLRILIVDDNRDAAATLGRLLRFSGYQTEVAFDGSRALNLAVNFRPQLALLDIGMPTMDGYELARCLKREYPGIYIAAVSGYGQAADRQRSKEAGFDEHFLKPVKLERLLSLLEEPTLGASNK